MPVKRLKGALLLRQFIDETPGMNQRKLAEGIGADQSKVSKYCRSERRPNYATRKRIEIFTSGFVPADSWDLEDETSGEAAGGMAA